MRIRSVTAAALLLGVGAANADTLPTIDAAIKQASSQEKPLIVEFGTTWCKPCRLFEAEVLPKAEVKESLKGAVFIRYDAEEEPGLAAAVRYGVMSYPTFLAIDSAGVVRARRGGMAAGDAGVTDFVQFVKDARQSVAEEAGIRANLAKSPGDPEVQLTAARWYEERNRTAEALVFYDAVVAAPKAPSALRARAAELSSRLRRVTNWRRELLAEKLELVTNHPAMPGIVDALLLVTLDGGLPRSRVESLFKAAIEATTSVGQLNMLMYAALAAGAKEAALAGAKKAEAMGAPPPIMDTVAEVYHARGQREEALRVEDAVVAKMPKDEGIIANRKRFAETEDECDEVTQLRTRPELVRKGLASVEKGSTDGKGPPPAMMGQIMAWRGTTSKMASKAAEACRAHAGSLKEAYVRVQLRADGGTPTAVTVLEPGASKALSQCIAKEISATVLPKSPTVMKQDSWVGPVRFEEPHADG